MSGMRNARRDQAAGKPQSTPLDFAQGRLVYTSQVRRRRNRMYLLAAALFILAVGTGVVLVLLANWLSTVMK
jgi:hypothetical protein